jgi:hypothetical protein
MQKTGAPWHLPSSGSAYCHAVTNVTMAPELCIFDYRTCEPPPVYSVMSDRHDRSVMIFDHHTWEESDIPLHAGGMRPYASIGWHEPLLAVAGAKGCRA